MTKPICIPPVVKGLLARLQAAGESAYVVGGCVRDSLLGKAPHDWDICTSAVPEKVKAVFGADCRVLETGLKHGTVSVLPPPAAGGTGDIYEITTFRTDGRYTDGRHPDSVAFAADVREDLARRDFTVNAMAYNDGEGLVDPFGGRPDLERRILRGVGDPAARFSEDALRILRAVRFSAQLGFCVQEATADAMCRCMDKLDGISAERIGEEFRKIVCGPYAARAIRAHTAVICKIIPELAPAAGCEQNSPYHCTDVFEHTMWALQIARGKTEFPAEWADDAVYLALFFHDLGKPETKTTGADGYDHFYGHPAVSARLAEQVMARLRYSNAFKDTVTELVQYHDITLAPNKRCARRMLNKFSLPQLERLLKVQEADNRAHTEAAFPLFENTKGFYACLKAVLEEQSAFSLRDLAINGRDLMELGLLPGPAIGAALNRALDAVIDETVPNERDALLRFVAAL